MNASTIPAEIARFAAEVRNALADLPADEIEELTDGLEADLTEAFREDLARELPDPAEYAEELRGAAGLPTRAARRSRVRDIGGSIVEMSRDVNRSLRRNPAMAATLDFLATLRPAWWIVRGWAAYQTFGGVFGFEGDLLPAGFGQNLLMIALVVGSVLVGLRTWPAWVQTLIWLGNAWAVVMTLVMLGQIPTHAQIGAGSDEYDYGYESGVGVTSGGMDVTNIFAYDATGQPITGVQLFDQDGQPIQTTLGGSGCLVRLPDDDLCQTPGAWVPTTLETGVGAWNVYPLRLAESADPDPSTPVPGAAAQDLQPPFIQVPALQQVVQPQQPRQSAAPEAEKKP